MGPGIRETLDTLHRLANLTLHIQHFTQQVVLIQKKFTFQN